MLKVLNDIKDIDVGGVVDGINAHLAVACKDLIARQDVGGKRTVTLDISLKPEKNSAGEVTVSIVPKFGVKLPGFEGLENIAIVEGGKVKIYVGDEIGQQTLLPKERGE